ncbi:molybdopterin-binding protein [Nitrososphaera sp.]|uniref:competence/damage-inducible protein A n=1 Tax=Nitrososphaera sp. TaxID=1971748 RepID=UPI00307E271C
MTMMLVEILCVGNELLSGITMNTNAHWIAGRVAAAGGTVSRITVVRDELAAISSAVKESLARKPGILVITGGLGATYDDMTLEGVAAALGRPLVLDKKAAGMLKNSYKRRGLKYRINRVRLKMATIPQGATPIENMVGSAPSVAIDSGKGTKIFCTPGVPSEMKDVFKKHVLPLVRRQVGRFSAEEANYMVAGVSEAMIAPALAKIVGSNPPHSLYLKTHPRGYLKKPVMTPRIRVQLICKGDDREEVKERHRRVSALLLKEIRRLGGRLEERRRRR